MNLDNCKECKESKCIMSKYYGIENIEGYDDELKYQKRIKQEYNKKIKAYYIKETKYHQNGKEREHKLTNYDRMNESDIRHQNNWNLHMNALIELQEKYYSNIKY